MVNTTKVSSRFNKFFHLILFFNKWDIVHTHCLKPIKRKCLFLMRIHKIRWSPNSKQRCSIFFYLCTLRKWRTKMKLHYEKCLSEQLNDIWTLILKRSYLFEGLTQLRYQPVLWMFCLIIVHYRGALIGLITWAINGTDYKLLNKHW